MHINVFGNTQLTYFMESFWGLIVLKCPHIFNWADKEKNVINNIQAQKTIRRGDYYSTLFLSRAASN